MEKQVIKDNYNICAKILKPYVKQKLMGPIFFHAIEKALEDNLLFYEKNNEDIVGFALLRKRKKDNAIILEKIAIDQNCKNLGFGKKLMEKILNVSLNCSKIELSVVSTNNNAIDFYKRFGFMITGEKITGKNKDIKLTLMEKMI